jgi:hypothetical protein
VRRSSKSINNNVDSPNSRGTKSKRKTAEDHRSDSEDIDMEEADGMQQGSRGDAEEGEAFFVHLVETELTLARRFV